MSDNILSARPDFGRTFNTAMWVIGSLAAVQVLAAGWAVISHQPLPSSEARTSVPVSLPKPLPPPAPSRTVQGEYIPIEPKPPVPVDTISVRRTSERPRTTALVKGESLQEPSFPSKIPPPATEDSILPPARLTGPDTYSGSLGSALAEAVGSVEKIDDPLLERLVSTGEELRTSGNMLGALKALREAETALPEEPRILSDLAGTFSQMGMEEKARNYWEKVVNLGAARAGDYYGLAEKALRGEQAAPVGSTTDILKIREVRVDQQAPGKEGQWVSLKVVIEGDPSVHPVGSDLALIVSFYDRVNGKKTETSTADTSQKFPSAPYDWQDGGTEEIEVIYHQPVFTVEQKRELGEHVYYGYVIELYYRDQFQDSKAFPEELQQLRIKEMNDEQKKTAPHKETGPDNSLFPSPQPNP